MLKKIPPPPKKNHKPDIKYNNKPNNYIKKDTIRLPSPFNENNIKNTMCFAKAFIASS